jgi:phosphoenolpyruvate synthase/pyruvate phosphate dikinase
VLEDRAGEIARYLEAVRSGLQAGGSVIAIAPEWIGPEALARVAMVRSMLDTHRLALRCEESFPGPSDIEWAFAGGALWLLQRRPLTGLGWASTPVS